MNKKLSTLCLLGFMFLGNSLFAQEKTEKTEKPKIFNSFKGHTKVGVDLGVTSGLRQANFSAQQKANYLSKQGFGINLSGEYLFYKNLALQSGISFWQKNYEFARTNEFKGQHLEHFNNYFSVPLMLGIYIFGNPYEHNGIWAKVAVGGYASYFASMRRKGTYEIFNNLTFDGTFDTEPVEEKYDFKENMNHLRRFEFGYQLQGQLGYSHKKYDVYGAFNFQQGLTDVNTYNTNKNLKNTMQAVMISVGASYKF